MIINHPLRLNQKDYFWVYFNRAYFYQYFFFTSGLSALFRLSVLLLPGTII